MKKKTVADIPNCDFCGAPAKYDAPTKLGSWAYLCPLCFELYRGPNADAGFELVEKTTNEKQAKARAQPQKKIPTVTLPLTWDSVVDVDCPFCGYTHSVEPDANYTVTCDGCGKKYKVRSMI